MLLLLQAAAIGQARYTRQDAASAYVPLRKHPELFSQHGWHKWVHPPLLEAIEELKASGNDTALRALLREEIPGAVYSFQLVSDSFANIFLEELDGYYASGLPIDRPNSMNNYGIIVNNIGMRSAITHLQRTVLQPMADALYPTQAAGGFDGHHSFMVQYKAGQDLGLDMHTDDSDVTFNVCLGRNFTGAGLTLCGDSRVPTHRQFYKSYEHVVGRCLVHLSSRRHGADDIREGERNNLIIWNSNQKFRASADAPNNQPYYPEGAPPDPRCLSYTHDRDFGVFLDYPPGKAEFKGGGWCPPSHACYDSMEPVLQNPRGRYLGRPRKDEL